MTAVLGVLFASATGVTASAVWALWVVPAGGGVVRLIFWLAGSLVVALAIAGVGAFQGAKELHRLRPFRRVTESTRNPDFHAIVTAVSAGNTEQRPDAEAVVDGFNSGDWRQLADDLSSIRPSGVVLSAVARTAGSLRNLVLVPSDSSFDEAVWIKALVERLYEKVGRDVTVVIAGRGGSPVNPRDMSTGDCADYQDVEGMYKVFDKIVTRPARSFMIGARLVGTR